MTSAQAYCWNADDFPCTLTLNIPFPTPTLASIAQRVLSVDAELSPLVRRWICLASDPEASRDARSKSRSHSHSNSHARSPSPSLPADDDDDDDNDKKNKNSNNSNVLHVCYAATTDRMLRVAVNGFLSSLGVVLGAMKCLDVDVVYECAVGGLEGVQGLEGGG